MKTAVLNPELPSKPCSNCGCKIFWLRKAHGVAYVCTVCHPPPISDGDKLEIYEVDADVT